MLTLWDLLPKSLRPPPFNKPAPDRHANKPIAAKAAPAKPNCDSGAAGAGSTPDSPRAWASAYTRQSCRAGGGGHDEPQVASAGLGQKWIVTQHLHAKNEGAPGNFAADSA